MTQYRTRMAIVIVLLLALVLTVILSIRGANQANTTPTLNMGEVQTAAVGTFASGLTQTVEAIPSATSTGTPAPTETASATDSVSTTPTCARLIFVKDVTIPDNTKMTPGQSFTKTWLVENNGTCAWQNDFQFSWFGGDSMSGQALTLNQTVGPGQRIELSVPMIAPTGRTGILQSTWRMSDADGHYFGDALTVVIDLGGSTVTQTATP